MNIQVFAQESLGKIGGEGFGPFGKKSYGESGTGALQDVVKVVSNVIGFMTLAASIWFLFQITIGGFNWLTSGGDKNNLENARNRITHAFIGLIIVVAGWGILALAGQFFGYDILISNSDIINKIQFK